ncbi:MAG: DUF2807 domain-containing protein [Flavobacteriaceae bacterium]|jgi:hypothetical protein|nr:DUF2807 domain-containing protein [Flavobacteriaceae bacterium]
MKFIPLILAMLVFQTFDAQVGKTKNTTYTTSGKGEKIRGNENIIEVQKSVGNYSRISSGSFVDIVLTEGNVGEITIKAESNLIDFIEVENKSGLLNVGVKKNVAISTKKGVVVYIPVDKVTSIKTSGSGDVLVEKDLNVGDLTLEASGSSDIVFKKVKATSFFIKTSGSSDISLQDLKVQLADISLTGSSTIKIDLNAEVAKANISGSGDLSLTGKTKDFKVNISGSADVKVDEFIAEEAEVSVSGSGTIVLYANKTIAASVSGSGDIFYKGNATVISSKVSGSGSIKKL